MVKFICYNCLPLCADHVIDFTKEFYSSCGVKRLHDIDSFNPYSVRSGDVIFVKSDFIVNGDFVKHLDKIVSFFSLITGNSSYHIGRDGGSVYKKILNDPRLEKWYCVNPPEENNEKFVPIPIGFEEPSRMGSNQDILEKYYSIDLFEKSPLVLLPYHTEETNPERSSNIEHIKKQSFTTHSKEKKEFDSYLHQISEYEFVACLEGSGPDIHRAYEALLVGTVPIIKRNVLVRLFDYYKLPYVAIDKWSELSDDWFNEVRSKKYDFNNVKNFLLFDSLKKMVRGE